MSDAPRLRAGFVAAAAVVAAAFWYGAVAPRNPDFDTTTVLEGWRRDAAGSLAPLAVATAVLGLVFVFAGRIERVAALAGRAIRGPGGAALLPVTAAIWLMWTTLDTSLSGDALDIVQRTARHDIAYDHPLSGLLYYAVHRWTGADACDAVRITSSVCGTLYALVVLAYCAGRFHDAARSFAAAVLLLTAGCVALFSGSVEVYAPAVLAFLVFLVLALRRLGDDDATRGAYLAPATAFGVFAACHGIAAFAGAAVILLLLHERRRGAGAAKLAAWCVVAVLPLVICHATLHLTGLGVEEPAGAGDRFLPLAKNAGNVQHRYAFLDAEHLIGVLATLFVAAPTAWAVLCGGRLRVRDRADVAFLAAAAAPLIALPFVWNIAYTVRRDWDLFSLLGVPLSLLAVRAVVAEGLSRADAVRIAALAWFTFVPLVRTSTGDAAQRRDYAVAVRWALTQSGATSDVTAPRDARIRELDPLGVAARLDSAFAAVDSAFAAVDSAFAAVDAGRAGDAETIARSVLADEPENVHALTLVGEILLAQADTAADPSARDAEAEALLRRAIRVPRENLRPGPRLALAKLMLRQGRRAEARAQLDRLVREDCQHPVAAEALTLLAPLVRETGDIAAAAVITDLAAKRRAR